MVSRIKPRTQRQQDSRMRLLPRITSRRVDSAEGGWILELFTHQKSLSAWGVEPGVFELALASPQKLGCRTETGVTHEMLPHTSPWHCEYLPDPISATSDCKLAALVYHLRAPFLAQ